MKLRKEFQAIVDEVYASLKVGTFDTRFALEAIAERCQALADKPPKMLNLEEIERIFKDTTGSTPGRQSTAYAVAIEAAHIAKQQEPETRKMKICIYKDQDGDIHAASAGIQVPDSITMIDSFEREVTL